MGNDIADRIDLILLEFQLAPSAFADAIQIPRAVMSHILSRRNRPSLEVVQKILKQYTQINSDWLINGIGTMIQLNLFEDVKTSSVATDTLKSTSGNISHQESIADIKSKEHPQTIAMTTKGLPKNEVLDDVKNPVLNLDSSSIYSANSNQEITSETVQLKKEKQIEKIIFFYSDKSFSVHFPEFQ